MLYNVYRVLPPLLLLLLLLLLLCVAIVVLLLQQQCRCFLLLLVIVCRMAKFGAGSSKNLIPVFSSSSFKRDFFFNVSLGSTVSHLQSRFADILGNCGHARSQGGRQPATAKPPSYI